MSEINYEEFYNKVGSINGWNFSDIRCTSIGMEWDFFSEVEKHCNTKDVLLDIGTGGGENLLQISSAAFLLIGIDLSSAMIEAAQINVKKAEVHNTKFHKMDANEIMFPSDFFDIVSSRHAPFNACEVARVLKTGGILMTQQVSENDKKNLKTYFNRGQSFDDKDGTFKRQCVETLKIAGFSEVAVFEYDATEYYERPEDLIFLLKHTPIIPNFGENLKDYEVLAKFIADNTTDAGIMTNSKRFMIVAKL